MVRPPAVELPGVNSLRMPLRMSHGVLERPLRTAVRLRSTGFLRSAGMLEACAGQGSRGVGARQRFGRRIGAGFCVECTMAEVRWGSRDGRGSRKSQVVLAPVPGNPWPWPFWTGHVRTFGSADVFLDTRCAPAPATPRSRATPGAP